MHINYLAVLVAAILNMVIGALWYSPMLFGKSWSQAIGKKMEEMGSGGTGYAITILASLVTAYVLAYLVSKLGLHGFWSGTQLGLVAWLGFTATTHASNYAFEGKSMRLYSINLGYFLVSFLLMGGLLGAWR
jgi:hypothetical protein